ncbi:putative Zn finger protein [Haloactinopolyspora alba]|uniref:Putative Zn finger protein n=1 Tax=Haloactinopolyspora alba TaxID=648780 RepID=A0A2P8EG77_9ACTN|nr:hypothetical protein [Haloactinopolyspora alba]PSL08444.1 putative Zn finger protein [Haloactinopolyspora alba]
MTWSQRLEELTDGRTIERGQIYAASGRVESLREADGRVSATVQGTEKYRVELTADTYWCDCPVGVTGEFCKHCVAVAVEYEYGSEASAVPLAEHDVPAPDASNGVALWLDGLSADELRTLLVEAIERVDGMAEFVARAQIDATDDLATLADEVADTFSPRRRFYDYRDANDYATGVEPLVQLIEDRAAREGTAEFLRIVQKAIDQAVRTILRSDDSSGLQGMQIDRLLDAHLRAATRSSLSKADAKKLVTWLASFTFSGKQDFFHIDIDKYAHAIGPAGLQEYRRRLDAAAAKDSDDLAVRYAHGRLVILDGDVEQIVAHFGGALEGAYSFVHVVEALEEAGHATEAVDYARRGVAAHPQAPQLGPLVERVVSDARGRGALDEVVAVRRSRFEHHPSTTTFLALERDAVAAGQWTDSDHAATGAALSKVDPRGWVNLLHERRDDAAWTAALDAADRIDVDLWTKLLARRAKTDPASTLPHYQRLVDDVLVKADRQNYRTAARLLRDMRDAASAAGISPEFERVLADIKERNRRRPKFFDELRRAGLTR